MCSGPGELALEEAGTALEGTALYDSPGVVDGMPSALGQDGAVALAGTTAADFGSPWGRHHDCLEVRHTKFAALARAPAGEKVRVDWSKAAAIQVSNVSPSSLRAKRCQFEGLASVEVARCDCHRCIQT